ncbi:helix-turn-helix domain-containing protein [Spirillospora sp. NPDC048911]|uniref:helix-turn-helix domain-containing protein n=1 Tax=Spirillospora sp. NPDC048911 TaxID=3364527 RepID=UPI003722F11D
MGSTAESIDPMAGLWECLAVQLRKHRVAAKESQAGVGKRVLVDHKTVSNWEAGRNHPPVEALRTLDEAWGTGGLLEALHHFANTMQAPAQFLAVVEYEALATMMRVNGVAIIPGLLQTPEYARAIFTMAGSADVEGQVAQRAVRQSTLTRADPPYISVLLSEVSLILIPPEYREDQLKKLAEIAELPHVTLRLVPVNAGLVVGLEGEFYLFSTPEREVGWAESSSRGRLVTDRDDLRKLAVSFDRTSGRALSPEATRARLRDMIEGNSDEMA